MPGHNVARNVAPTSEEIVAVMQHALDLHAAVLRSIRDITIEGAARGCIACQQVNTLLVQYLD